MLTFERNDHADIVTSRINNVKRYYLGKSASLRRANNALVQTPNNVGVAFENAIGMTTLFDRSGTACYVRKKVFNFQCYGHIIGTST
tara:strand:- start:3789 stop:4049 length:261 start_codon:yes stop_codon:yes gene_type:complete